MPGRTISEIQQLNNEGHNEEMNNDNLTGARVDTVENYGHDDDIYCLVEI